MKVEWERRACSSTKVLRQSIQQRAVGKLSLRSYSLKALDTAYHLESLFYAQQLSKLFLRTSVPSRGNKYGFVPRTLCLLILGVFFLSFSLFLPFSLNPWWLRR